MCIRDRYQRRVHGEEEKSQSEEEKNDTERNNIPSDSPNIHKDIPSEIDKKLAQEETKPIPEQTENSSPSHQDPRSQTPEDIPDLMSSGKLEIQFVSQDERQEVDDLEHQQEFTKEENDAAAKIQFAFRKKKKAREAWKENPNPIEEEDKKVKKIGTEEAERLHEEFAEVGYEDILNESEEEKVAPTSNYSNQLLMSEGAKDKGQSSKKEKLFSRQKLQPLDNAPAPEEKTDSSKAGPAFRPQLARQPKGTHSERKRQLKPVQATTRPREETQKYSHQEPLERPVQKQLKPKAATESKDSGNSRYSGKRRKKMQHHKIYFAKELQATPNPYSSTWNEKNSQTILSH
eukprot:TRINITY_DN5478_c0_g1_i2.p1 TRINITY_DN5478_c0_g1~~TRINITY_DN5478_c0_g1_i2.p1  ORF type:complete len:346 (+),score=88.68 TRINITY_DN5478_c0_g1_i2:66-1103(+)